MYEAMIAKNTVITTLIQLRTGKLPSKTYYFFLSIHEIDVIILFQNTFSKGKDPRIDIAGTI